MALKLLKDVQEGQIIKVGGAKHKVSKSPFGILLTKELMPGIFGGTPKDVAQAIAGYSGAGTTFVEVVEVGTAPKTDLTSQLRAQQKQKSLTDSLRSQKAAADEDEYDDYDDEDYDDEYDDEDDDEELGYDYYSPVNLNPHAHSQVSALDGVFRAAQAQPVITFNGQVPAIDAVKASALSANLKAQQASQSAISAKFEAVLAKNKARGVEEQLGYIQNGLSSLDYDVASARQAAEDVSDELERFADVAYDAQDAAYEAIHRVAAIEAKQKEEEVRMNLQDQLNAKLAAGKQQADLQAQLNQKLNQKTTGGNGTMKKLFGAAFNFGKVEGKFAFSPITGGLALRKGLTNDFVAYNKDTKELTDVSGLTLKFDVPAFKLPTAAAAVEVGDFIIHNGEYVAVTKKNDGYLEVINPEKGVNGSVIPTKNALLGSAFYTVVKTLDAAGGTGFNPMLLMALDKGSDKKDLLPLLLMSGGIGNGTTGSIDPTMLMLLGDDVEDLLPLVLMQQGGVAGQGFNPLMFMLMNKGGKGKDLLPLLMMQQQGGAAGAINPMMMMALAGDGELDLTTLALMGGFGQGGLFGQAPTAAAKEVKGNK